MAPIQPLSALLGLQELDNHRALVAVEMEVLAVKVDRFGWNRMSDAMKDRLISGRMNVLQDFHLGEIQDACAKSLGANPRKCPNEIEIKGLIDKARDRRGDVLRKPSGDTPLRASECPEKRKRISEKYLGTHGFAGVGSKFDGGADE